MAEAGGLEEIEANDWAGDGKMLGDTEADDGADCMLEFGEAEPVDDDCGGYCISNFIGLQAVTEDDTDLLLYKTEVAAADGENSLTFVKEPIDEVVCCVAEEEAAKEAVA